MNLIILVSSLKGSGAFQLEKLIKVDEIDIKMVLFNRGQVSNKKKYYSRKIKKVFKIGMLGAFNGIRIRKWYSEGADKYLDIRSIKEICLDNNILFNETTSINCGETIRYFKEAEADLGLSLGNGYIGSRIFNIPKYGMINIHHEELPNYQNSQSIIWQIYNNSSYSGYTIHKIDKHIDTGKILLKERIPLVFRATLEDTVSYNYVRLWEKSSIGLIKLLCNFDYYLENSISQEKGTSYTTPSISQFVKMKINFKKMKKNKH